MHVVAKKVKKAAAKESSRLVSSPKPLSGKPRTVPPLERSVLAAFRPERRDHPAVAALLAELAQFGAGYGPT